MKKMRVRGEVRLPISTSQREKKNVTFGEIM